MTVSAENLLRLVVLLGVALAVGPAFGWGLPLSLAVTTAAALAVTHERRVAAQWRRAPRRLAAPR